MGSLKELRIPEEHIETGGGKLTLHGVSLPDIAQLVRHHGPVLKAMFSDLMAGKNVTLNLEMLTGIGNKALATAPVVVAELIALASGDGDDESIKIASKLPAPVQVEAIEKIARLTFAMEGGLPKLVETVIRVAQGTTESMAELQRPLTNGSGASAPT